MRQGVRTRCARRRIVKRANTAGRRRAATSSDVARWPAGDRPRNGRAGEVGLGGATQLKRRCRDQPGRLSAIGEPHLSQQRASDALVGVLVVRPPSREGRRRWLLTLAVRLAISRVVLAAVVVTAAIGRGRGVLVNVQTLTDRRYQQIEAREERRDGALQGSRHNTTRVDALVRLGKLFVPNVWPLGAAKSMVLTWPNAKTSAG